MAFWIRNDSGGDYTINDLGVTILTASEMDLWDVRTHEHLIKSVDLHSAFVAGDLVRLDGPGGSPVTPGTEFDDLVNVHTLDGNGHSGNLGFGQLDSINGTLVEKAVPVGADILLIEDSAAAYGKKKVQVGNLPTSGGGEANTASNQGVGGVGFYDAKVGVDLQFRNLTSTTDRIGVALDAVNKEVDLTLNEGNIVHQNLSGSGVNTHAQIDTHIASTTNPHAVTKTQVGLGNVTDDAQLKRAAGDIASFAEKLVPSNADILLIEDSADANNKKKVQIGNLPSSGGEANTASNQGTGGVGFYDAKVGVDLQFRNLTSTTNRIGVALDAVNKEVDLTLNEGNIVHQNLSGAGVNTHAQIDTHIASTANPHATDIGNLGTGTLAELNTKITDATLDDSGDPRTPTLHASTHENGGADEISVAGLSGVLADPQTPTTHEATHENGGADELPHQNLNGAGVNTHAQIDTHIASTANPHAVTKTQVGLGNVTDDAQLKRAAGDFATFAEKVVPANADILLLEDSADSNNKKKVQIGNLPGGGSGPGANMKAGAVLNATFVGNPKIATVSFTTAYSDSNYAVTLCCLTNFHVQFAPGIENKTAAGFDINMGANNINGLVQVEWTTAPYGEA
jgi:hypothetical protein